MKKICVVVSSVLTVKAFLLDQISELNKFYDLRVIANVSEDTNLGNTRLELIAAPIERKISPLNDLRALFHLFRLFKSNRFDAVHSVTPKAGFLAMLAGFLARVPVRIHTYTGQVWVTRRGIAREFLKLMDRLIGLFATHVLIDSPSQREFLLAQGVVSSGKSSVLGKGSISGVDTARFKPDPQLRAELRRQLGYGDGDIVFLYLGRVNRDKGMPDLAAAFVRVTAAPNSGSARLLVVGPDEDDTRALMLAVLGKAGAQARFVDFADRPQDYMAAADVFCLPSYREGFGSVVIEAAACGVPAVASRIYGLTDAVADGVTGILHAPGDIDALATAMKQLAVDPKLRRKLGEAARQRALVDFPMTALTSALLGFYAKILN